MKETESNLNNASEMNEDNFNNQNSMDDLNHSKRKSIQMISNISSIITLQYRNTFDSTPQILKIRSKNSVLQVTKESKSKLNLMNFYQNIIELSNKELELNNFKIFESSKNQNINFQELFLFHRELIFTIITNEIKFGIHLYSIDLKSNNPIQCFLCGVFFYHNIKLKFINLSNIKLDLKADNLIINSVDSKIDIDILNVSNSHFLIPIIIQKEKNYFEDYFDNIFPNWKLLQPKLFVILRNEAK